MKIVATVEARMNSSRLPGKVLMDIGGIKSLDCQVQRLRKSKYLDDIVIATTANLADDEIEKFANQNEIKVYRGSEDDVMMRILRAAQSVDADLQVQTTGDCPLIDAQIVDLVINTFLEANGRYDFVSNEIVRSYPIGLDCRVFPVKVLAKAESMCTNFSHRVHGSTFIYSKEGRVSFQCKNIVAPNTLNKPNYRWTLDELDDLEFIKKVIDNFKPEIFDFSSHDLMNWLNKNPEIVSINAHVKQKKISEG